MPELYIGLMSGTSTDAVDAALVEFTDTTLKLKHTHSKPLSPKLKQTISSICHPGADEINRVGQLDVEIGLLFAQTCNELIQNNNITPTSIRAIGSHGQTIRHQPNFNYPFTLQIGDPNIIAEKTGILTIADFRRRDLAAGGQGAPLTPTFHNYILRHPSKNRAIVNIGGIANVTLLPANSTASVIGFDTGPGNILLDAWSQKILQKPFDQNGNWAANGHINNKLLNSLLADPYFQQTPPKSTGREYFNLQWLEQFPIQQISAEDVQATLTELTALTILYAIANFKLDPLEILICGGGVRNDFLFKRLQANSKNNSIHSTAEFGVDPAWIEATAFAWLAKQTLEHKPGNLPAVTGAKHPVILGAIYPGALQVQSF